MNIGRLALRNLGRRRGRTALTLIMLAVCTALVVFATGLADGSYAYMIRATTDMWNGQAQIIASDFEDSPSLFETLSQPEHWIDRLEAHPDVVAATPRIETAGLLSAGARTAGVAIVGVDPLREPRVSTFPNAVREGRWLPPSDTRPQAHEEVPPLPIVIGRGVAERLGAGLGEELVYLGQAADGSIAAALCQVFGIIETGSDELDAATAFAPYSDLAALLELTGRAHRIAIRLHHLREPTSLQQSLDLPGPRSGRWSSDAPPELWSWRALSPNMVDSIEADQTGDTLFRAVLVLVALLGLANTLMMSVYERRRELGILGAIGTSPARLLGLAAAEGIWLATIGVSVGTLMGAALNASFATDGIVFTAEPIEFGGMAFDRMFSANTWQSTGLYPLILWFGGAIAGLWPAWHAARLDPVQAMRQG